MRYTVTRQIIQVIGCLWMGGTAAMEYTLSAYDIENIEDVHDRESVADWLGSHSGDFQSVTDFRADFTLGDESVVHDWKSEDSEFIFSDCMYPMED